MNGTCYIVSTPIGNWEDITHRALRILSEVDSVVCEERKTGASLLSHDRIQKPLVELNEHTEAEIVPLLVKELREGRDLALISDHGTPLVEDPGDRLVHQAVAAGIRIAPVPGPSVIIAAIVASGIPARRFKFLGQLPRKVVGRRNALRELEAEQDTMVLLDAPYRLYPVLQDIKAVFGAARHIAVACNLTMPDEMIVRGSVEQVIEAFKLRPFKGEFALTVEGNQTTRSQRRS